jgi:6-phosphogluconate dehydrogenase
MSAALSHFDSLTSPFLPANLVQGQRDCFGAHTYQRVDRDGTFHTDWIEGRQYRPRPCATDGPGRK